MRRTPSVPPTPTPTITPESEPDAVHHVWRAGWWPVAKAIVETGHDCTVLDPDADADDVYFDGDPNHGVVQVRTHVGLGWTVLVSECEHDLEDGDDDLG